MLEAHAARMAREAQADLSRARCRRSAEHGTFFAPRAFEIDRAGAARARGVRPDPARACAVRRTGSTSVLDAINATGYGLTLGIHSRIDETVRAHPRAARASATPTSTAT